MITSSPSTTTWALTAALGVAGATFIYSNSKRNKGPQKSQFYAVHQVGKVLKQDDVQDAASDDLETTYDFIIVGGGTAALVLANRLTEDPSITVLVLEAGGSSSSLKASNIPVLFKYLQRGHYDWNYKTTPQEHLNGRECHWTRAKLLGGCTTSNAMMFHFGTPEDYDEWDQIAKRIDSTSGAEDWGYQEMKKYFLKMERYVPHPDVPIDTTERGKNGPVQSGYHGYFSKFGAAFLKSCEAVGIPMVDDINTSKGTLGVTRTPTYIDSRGRRVTVESSYLTPDVLSRPNLKVAIGAHVKRIRFEEDSTRGTKRAIGVEFVPHVSGEAVDGSAPDTRSYFAWARKEVILSAGAVNTPQILLLSGIGPSEELNKHSIPVIQDLPGVGRNLRDHLVINTHYKTRPGVSNTRTLYPSSLTEYLAHWRAIGQYIMFRTGLLTSQTQCAMGFLRVDDPSLFGPSDHLSELEVDSTSLGKGPDLEVMGSALAWKDHGHGKFLGGSDAASISMVLLRPTSKDLTELLKSRVETLYHPTSTARMAPLSEGGVVNDKLQVYGVEGLRIVDASIMPEIVSGHTAGPTIGIAEKAADIIKTSL
ncbi:hypothetical protein FRC03_011321 [Tulasnella sp. 419]|nr:hypothetical protein FRC03_011321 [Tulasnella sp. 419]